MPLRLLPIPFLHVSLARPKYCFVCSTLVTRVPSSWNLLDLSCLSPILRFAFFLGLCFLWAICSVLRASSLFWLIFVPAGRLPPASGLRSTYAASGVAPACFWPSPSTCVCVSFNSGILQGRLPRLHGSAD